MAATQKRTCLIRALAVWGVLIGVEIIHGMLRTLLLAPHVGDLPARQIGVFTGSALNLLVAYLFARWMGARTTTDLLTVGLLWLTLTLLFELSFGRLVVGASWQRLLSDYDLTRGGLLPLGLILLTLTPLLAARLRGCLARREETY